MFSKNNLVAKQSMISAFVSHSIEQQQMLVIRGGEGGGGSQNNDDDVTKI